jgi:hypothetical protein
MELRKITVWKLVTVILAVLLVASIFTSGFKGVTGAATTISKSSAVQKALTFINENMLQEGMLAELKESVEENGLYKFVINIDGRDYDSYVTKDGKMLFTTPGVDLDEAPESAETQEAAPEPADVPKSDKPEVEVFVMSHCPFGTQIEKGIIPVVKALGSKIDFKLRFVNYAMHGEKELDEQMNQYCIQKEESSKLIPYLECFLADGDTDRCMEEVEIDQDMLADCLESTEEEFKIKELFADQETWMNGRFPQFPIDDTLNTKYGIRGSPGLVINGEQVSSARSPAALLATVCNAFNTKPSGCDEELDSANPSAGFGYEPAAAATASGGCGG